MEVPARKPKSRCPLVLQTLQVRRAAQSFLDRFLVYGGDQPIAGQRLANTAARPADRRRRVSKRRCRITTAKNFSAVSTAFWPSRAGPSPRALGQQKGSKRPILLGRMQAAADRVTARLTLVGADPHDDDDLRARKALLGPDLSVDPAGRGGVGSALSRVRIAGRCGAARVLWRPARCDRRVLARATSPGCSAWARSTS
jgi:hypothetical protein